MLTASRWDNSVIALTTARIGRPLWHYHRVASTMIVAHSLALAGAPDGTAILANEQTAGRGRRGRRWHAPPGSALLCSVLLRPPLTPDQLGLLTMAVSVGLCLGIEQATGLQPALKWPNDLLLAGRKLAGILSESRFSGGQLSHVIVGFGLNLTVQPADVALATGGLPPTSLALALRHAPAPLPILQAVLSGIDLTYDWLWTNQSERLQTAWRDRLVGLGELVRVVTDTGEYLGRFASVDQTGAMILETSHGPETILAGDLILGPRPTT